MKRALRIFGFGFAALVVVTIAFGFFAWHHLNQSLPVLSGTVKAAGLSAPLEIARDREGVPHILAASAADGYFGLGYAHAQDRLWQMDFQRRVAHGRLSEFLGERSFDTDRLMRTLGFNRLSERIVAKLDPQTRGALESYAAGVNAYLAQDPVLPPEFHFFNIGCEPWKPADSIGWLLVMAWDLSGNWRTELARMRFAAKLGSTRTNELMPPYPGDAAISIPDHAALFASLEPQAKALLALSPGSEQAVGSNSWVLAGPRTQSGKPLLANDPHLGLQAPALWYLAHVSTPEGNVVGGTLPGVPFVVLGRNDHVAWTMTTTGGDTQDLFIEREAPGDPKRYVTPTGLEAFQVREEVIRVGSDERKILVRSTRHGPVLSDVVKNLAKAAPKGHVLALAWTALTEDNATARAGVAISRAKNVDDLMAAARDFHAPQQNLVFADSEGRVGMVAPAILPQRHRFNEAMGRVPVPGWDAKYDWTGMLPFEQVPTVLDPPSQRIVTANHKTTPPGYEPDIGSDWFPPYRAERIEQLLALETRHSPDSMMRIQADNISRLAIELMPTALAAKPATVEGRRAQALVASWRAAMVPDQAAPLVFSAWYREMTRLVYADELGEHFAEGWEMRTQFMVNVLRRDRESAKWCDNVSTPEKETCGQLAGIAFDRAAVDLEKRYGEPSKWRWGVAHPAGGMHRPMGFIPYVGHYFNVMPESPGDGTTVNVGSFTIRDEAQPFVNRHAPSLRMIFDFSDLDRSLYMHSTGQSGNVLSPWYSSLAQRWARVEYIAIPVKPGSYEVAHSLKLVP